MGKFKNEGLRNEIEIVILTNEMMCCIQGESVRAMKKYRSKN